MAESQRSSAVDDIFQPFQLDAAAAGIGLDDLPFGVIMIDRQGTISEYNAYESEMAGFAREKVLGRNFFRDVAPCTAIRDFEGRYEGFLDSDETSLEPFQFVFPFKTGPQRVVVLFVRLSATSEHSAICITRRPESPTYSHDGSPIVIQT